MVYKEFPFQMVVLVLEHTGSKAFYPLVMGQKVFVEIGDVYRFRATHVLVNAGYAETSFLDDFCFVTLFPNL